MLVGAVIIRLSRSPLHRKTDISRACVKRIIISRACTSMLHILAYIYVHSMHNIHTYANKQQNAYSIVFRRGGVLFAATRREIQQSD